MGNVLNTLKSILANKNTIAILGVLIGVVVIYMIYNSQIQSTTTTITVYYLKEDVKANTQLKENMLGTAIVNSNLSKSYRGLVTSLGQIQDSKGNYFFVNFDHNLKAGQLLSTEDLVSSDNKLPSKLYDLDENLKQFELEVDLDSTQGNSIAPGNSIDLWIQGKTPEDEQVIFTKFIENLKVIDVIDNQWITTAGNESGRPEYLVTAVDEDLWLLLQKAEKVQNYNFKLIPVVHDKAYDDNTEPKVYDESIKNIIEANTSYMSY